MTHDALLADRSNRRREHLMSETNHHAQLAGVPRRAKLLAGALLATVLAGGGTVAVAGVPSVLRQADGSVAIDGQSLSPSYYGRTLTLEQLTALQDKHLATSNVNNRELACHSVSLYFDTDAEADRYMADFEQRDQAAKARRDNDAQQATNATDPCADWRAPLPTFSAPARTS